MSDNKSIQASADTASSCKDQWKPQLRLDDGSVVDLHNIDEGLLSALQSRKKDGPITMKELVTLSMSMGDPTCLDCGEELTSDGIVVVTIPKGTSQDGQSR
ncbi:hypothetical protein L486_07288 [Kwoniella mangroviensis CBS 10435]|uniref:Uncharacterized protein n=1 Tax=Kwoniella mangroviensis CBS 10435 TaxID=1331196 RepID=A0A1B9II21_9TREE|nr:uncharacterized protein I203_04848 [Kwoniella mangroviensis CBS 8507]OCF55175.1 hypothetical protein L486_07288 [Kwoniella mangroviensis CBS 10435]OCF65828.1 hypothetical protein I203_04848 [Kwoniella mangroviensis CBS 8507]OCF72099.1 hypothetical protein I204_07363 [Kwoniella mangroviensis CBS 8886]